VHLHGARTPAGNDGHTENAVLPGDSQLAEYPNDQPATTLWYHDHAMDITRWNVMTGLALVNGVIWPHFDVAGRWYRFRVLNASNARIYQFQLKAPDPQDPTTSVAVPMHQIGTDSGLLGVPVSIDTLVLGPAERADILVDFRPHAGRQLTLVNLLQPPQVPGDPSKTNPDIMQFRVASRPAHDRFTLPATLSPSFRRLTHDTVPSPHGHRWVVTTPAGLASQTQPFNSPAHPELWEMAEMSEQDAPPVGSGAVEGIVRIVLPDGTRKVLKRVARAFEETATFFVEHNGWEVWNFLNIGGPTHPMHIHLTRFQALSRRVYDVTAVRRDAGQGHGAGPGPRRPRTRPCASVVRANAR
jgi:spore coat protein A